LIRAKQIACTAPCGPTFVSLDATLQEDPIDAPVAVPDMRRHALPELPAPTPAAVAEAARMLRAAKRPVIMMGRMGRDFEHWPARIRLAEMLNARVITDYKTSAMFPTDHPRHSDWPGIMVTKTNAALIREADVILSLDYIDIGGMMKVAGAGNPISAKLISVSLDSYLANGWSLDHFSVPEADLSILSTPDNFVAALLRELGEAGDAPAYAAPARPAPKPVAPDPSGKMTTRMLAETVIQSVGTREISLVRLPLRWPPSAYPFHHPLDYLGKDGGGGIGSGPGISVGCALALQEQGRHAVTVLGDGDFVMGANAIWTAVRHRIPLLILINNNRSYFNDELHQETVANTRGREPSNRWIGQRIADPEPDLAKLAEAQGAVGIGPVREAADVKAAIRKGVEVLKSGGVCLIDFHITPGEDRRAGSALGQRATAK
jgi:thiamine pyrophosphate-dependent acetolactate synthase large subunit-like protein